MAVGLLLAVGRLGATMLAIWPPQSSRLEWCNALARRTGGSGWLQGAHLLPLGVALVLVDEEERQRLG